VHVVEVEELVHHWQLPHAGGALSAKVARLDGTEVLGLLEEAGCLLAARQLYLQRLEGEVGELVGHLALQLLAALQPGESPRVLSRPQRARASAVCPHHP